MRGQCCRSTRPFLGESAGVPEPRPNLVCVICHDLGQHLGCYGVPGLRTPHLDAFAAAGLRFANSFCTAPQCSPSRSALWTGRYPHANGVVGLAGGGFENELHEGERHLAQILGEAGYETCLCGNQHVSARPERCGFGRIHAAISCVDVAPAAVEFLRNREPGGTPFFLQAAFFEPHRPFDHYDVEPLDPAQVHVPPYLPDIPEVREDLADLEASCASVDRAFGAIVQALDEAGLGDDTVVVFTADHGIAFPHAKMTLYDPGIETALLMRVPGTEGGQVYGEMISNVDVAPTVLDLLGLEIPANVQGRSFSGLLRGEGYEPREAVCAEKTYHSYYDPMRAIRTDRWKLIANFDYAPQQEISGQYTVNTKSYVEIIRARPLACISHPPFELYDLEADPWEQHDLADEPAHAEVRDGLIRRLRQWMEDTGDPLLEGPMAQQCQLSRMAAFLAT